MYLQETDEQYHENALYGAAQYLVNALNSAGPLQCEGALSIARLSLQWLTPDEKRRYFILERAVIRAASWEPLRRVPPNPFGDWEEPIGKITRGDL